MQPEIITNDRPALAKKLQYCAAVATFFALAIWQNMTIAWVGGIALALLSPVVFLYHRTITATKDGVRVATATTDIFIEWQAIKRVSMVEKGDLLFEFTDDGVAKLDSSYWLIGAYTMGSIWSRSRQFGERALLVSKGGLVDMAQAAGRLEELRVEIGGLQVEEVSE